MSNQLSQTDTFSDEQNITLKRKTSNAIGDRSARCHYCPKYWICGCSGEMEDHLVNICPGVPIEIK
ncbi:6734_t:CDS:2, partial [Gigaspora margarita]